MYVTLPDDTRLLVDTSPDLRQQALRSHLPRVDAVLYTHGHADHVLGLDELRRYNHLQRQRIPCYADPQTASELRRTFAYIFDERTPAGGGLPEIDLFPLIGPLCLGRFEVVPVPLWHGRRRVYGYRMGRLAYLTDCSALPDEAWPLLGGLDVLVLDALRHRPHPTHLSVGQALDVAARVGAPRTLFTHICHDLGHAETTAALPQGVDLAYDGLSVEFRLD
ncbi:MAG TPA: MBL fold metallo-hydrolase [Methylomirabilota bacterium]